MDYKMRTETHFSQPKKVRNTKCLDPLLLISPPASFQMPPFSILKQGAVWMSRALLAERRHKKSFAASA